MGDVYRGDIEIELVVDSLSKDFLISPNDLHRGRGAWAGLTLRARGMLAALLTMKSGWRVSRAVIDNLAPELGRKGVSTVLRELRDKNFLHTQKINGPDGRFTWRWKIHLTPNTTPEDISAAHTMGPSGDSGDHTMGPSGDSGADQEKQGVSAGRTIGPSATDGQGDLPRSTLLLENLKNTPPAPPPAPEPAATPHTETGGEDQPTPQNPHRAILDAAHTDACTRQPGWSPNMVADAMRDALQQGRTPHAIAAAIVALARGDHGPTASPRRLLADGPWWATRPAATPPPPRRPLCRKHNQPAHGCTGCVDDAREAHHSQQTGQTMTRSQAIAAIRSATHHARRKQATPGRP